MPTSKADAVVVIATVVINVAAAKPATTENAVSLLVMISVSTSERNNGGFFNRESAGPELYQAAGTCHVLKFRLLTKDARVNVEAETATEPMMIRPSTMSCT